MTLPIHFVVGLRSGSTLLLNILGQASDTHVTPTNDLIELLVGIKNQWMGLEAFKSQGLKTVEPRIRTLLRHAIHGFYEGEFAAGKTVFDKSRGWPHYIELIEQILGRPVKIVVCVRDIRDVVASFERKYRESSLTKADVGGEVYFKCQTVRGRAECLMSEVAAGGLFVNRLLDVYSRRLEDRLVIVPYRDLTTNPEGTIARVRFECGMTPFVCNPDNVQQITHEDDSVHGMDLHTIRPVVKPNDGTWRGVLPEPLAAWLNEQFSDIQHLAGVSD